MGLHYKWVVGQRACSRACVGVGVGGISYLFFKRLHQFLGCDLSIQAKKVTWSIKIVPGHQTVDPQPPAEGEDELITLNLMNIRHIDKGIFFIPVYPHNRPIG